MREIKRFQNLEIILVRSSGIIRPFVHSGTIQYGSIIKIKYPAYVGFIQRIKMIILAKEKTYQCDTCLKRFSTMSYLKNHKLWSVRFLA